jgi:hypothetical protein
MSSSVDARIKREAKLYKAEIDAANGRRLARLQPLLVDEAINMLARCGNSGTDKVPALWLHKKDYNQTYRDYAYLTKQYRTRVRVENLLVLCGGDKELLLQEWAVVLEKYFPIPGKIYAWKPQLITRGGRLTILHMWRRRQAS